jgi:hypothetical protein
MGVCILYKCVCIYTWAYIHVYTHMQKSRTRERLLLDGLDGRLQLARLAQLPAHRIHRMVV